MSDEMILEKIGMQNASDEDKQTTLNTVKSTVEMRLMGILGETISKEQMDVLEEMEKKGESRESMFSYLSEQLVDVNSLYEATLSDYLDEFIARQKRFGIS